MAIEQVNLDGISTPTGVTLPDFSSYSPLGLELIAPAVLLERAEARIKYLE